MTDLDGSGAPAGEVPGKGKQTVRFAAVMAAVLLAFVWLSSLGGPPMMPADKDHPKDMKDDNRCLMECHNWESEVTKGAPKVKKAMGPNHPPPRQKRKKLYLPDGGVDPRPNPECLKCHTPRPM